MTDRIKAVQMVFANGDGDIGNVVSEPLEGDKAMVEWVEEVLKDGVDALPGWYGYGDAHWRS